MWKILVVLVVVTVFAGGHVEATDCCSAYTDVYGTYHPTVLCEDYCCLNLDLGKLKTCCSDPLWRAPSDQRNDECLKSWVEEHVWVPIVGAIIFIGLIALCTCCCCCGCCGFCRKDPAPVIIHSAGAPQSTVSMQQTTVANTNPMHYGYNQA